VWICGYWATFLKDISYELWTSVNREIFYVFRYVSDGWSYGFREDINISARYYGTPLFGLLFGIM